MQTDFIICPMLYAIAMGQIIIILSAGSFLFVSDLHYTLPVKYALATSPWKQFKVESFSVEIRPKIHCSSSVYSILWP